MVVDMTVPNGSTSSATTTLSGANTGNNIHKRIWFHTTLVTLLVSALLHGFKTTHSNNLELSQDHRPYSSTFWKTKIQTQSSSPSWQEWLPDHNPSSSDQEQSLRFCQQPTVHKNQVELHLLYQCQGEAYNDFAHQLHSLAQERSQFVFESADADTDTDTKVFTSNSTTATTTSLWGRRPFPIPNNSTVLVLGNSHLRQVSKTIVCQYADVIRHLHYMSEDVFVVELTNGVTWISVTNTVLAYSNDWAAWMEEQYLRPYSDSTWETLDAVVFGKFTRYEEARGTNFEHTMQEHQVRYQSTPATTNTTITTTTTDKIAPRRVDFQTIPPPRLIDVVHHIQNLSHHSRSMPKLLSVPMFSSSDGPRMIQERLEYWDDAYDDYGTDVSEDAAVAAGTVRFINTRQYIDTIGMECGSDDKWTVGNCHEPTTTTTTTTTTTNADETLEDNATPALHLGGWYPATSNITTVSTPNVSTVSTPINDHPKDGHTDGSSSNGGRDPRDMHRCAGPLGGHADLVAFDVIEGLYDMLTVP